MAVKNTVNPRVFISYAHESKEFRAAIKALADWLVSKGLTDVITDHQHENRPPERGWEIWMQRQIEEADVVLVVCSPKYKARFEKREEPGTGKGATFEGAIITQDLYDASLSNTKFFPILPDGGIYEHIPQVLRSFDCNHRFPSGNDRILKLIMEDPAAGTAGAKTRATSIPPKDFLQRPPGQLTGQHDNRLAPREGKVFGREGEISEVLEFLNGITTGASFSTHVTGVAGVGKTEVCKAALKQWLSREPAPTPFYVNLPEDAEPGALFFHLGAALGAENVSDLKQLSTLLQPGLYYLDNLEGLAEKPQGREYIRNLALVPGVRILASSRVSLDGVLGKGIILDRLPDQAALDLFIHIWNGQESPAVNDSLRQFVLSDLGGHALTIAITARLGNAYSLERLAEKWKESGACMVKDGTGITKIDSLCLSLRFTSEVLDKVPGSLEIWTLAALFPDGLDEKTADHFLKMAGLNNEALIALCRHHILTLKEGVYEILSPIARFALDEAHGERGGFSFARARQTMYPFYYNLAKPADSIASTEKALNARSELLRFFPALHRFLLEESKSCQPDRAQLSELNDLLLNLYQFCASLSQEILINIKGHILSPAKALRVLGDLERHLGKPEEARRLYGEAIGLHRKEQDGLGLANALRALGELESRLGKPDQARGLYEQAIRLYKKQKSGLGLANGLQALGELERSLGKADEARGLYEHAIALYKKEQSGLGLANALRSLGDLESNLGKPDQAHGHYQEAIGLYQKEQSVRGLANALQALGDLERDLGKPDDARRLYEQAIALYKKVQSGLGLANALQSLGDLEQEAGRYETALTYYDKALQLYRTEQLPSGLAYTLAETVRCYHALGREEDKKEAALQAFLSATDSKLPAVLDYVLKALASAGIDKKALKRLLEKSGESG